MTHLCNDAQKQAKLICAKGNQNCGYWTSLVVQCLRLHTSKAGESGLIGKLRFSHTTMCGMAKKFN